MVGTYVLIHLILVTPLAYLPMMLASGLLCSIITSGRDEEISYGENSVKVKDLFNKDTVTEKCFVVGLPAMVLAFATKAVALFVSA